MRAGELKLTVDRLLPNSKWGLQKEKALVKRATLNVFLLLEL